MKQIILKKENGVVTKVECTPEMEFYIRNYPKHLCWEKCENACVSKCPKVADLIKKTIDQYDCITDGYQIIIGKDVVDTFIVSNCDKYEESIEREIPIQKKLEIKRIRDELLMNYFDTSTVEDAYITQYELMKAGKITPKGHRLPESDINRLILAKKNK